MQALEMGALPTLLYLLEVYLADKKIKGVQEALANTVVALMVGELRDTNSEEAAKARSNALHMVDWVLKLTMVDAVKVKLSSVAREFSEATI